MVLLASAINLFFGALAALFFNALRAAIGACQWNCKQAYGKAGSALQVVETAATRWTIPPEADYKGNPYAAHAKYNFRSGVVQT